jgi:hypothetical protein
MDRSTTHNLMSASLTGSFSVKIFDPENKWINCLDYLVVKTGGGELPVRDADICTKMTFSAVTR